MRDTKKKSKTRNHIQHYAYTLYRSDYIGKISKEIRMPDLKLIKFLMSPSDIKTIFELKGIQQQHTHEKLSILFHFCLKTE